MAKSRGCRFNVGNGVRGLGSEAVGEERQCKQITVRPLLRYILQLLHHASDIQAWQINTLMSQFKISTS